MTGSHKVIIEFKDGTSETLSFSTIYAACKFVSRQRRSPKVLQAKIIGEKNNATNI